MKTLKTLALMAELILALHGDFHPRHDDHAPTAARHAAKVHWGGHMADRRDRDHKWYSSFDEKRMIITIEGAGPDGEDLEVPAAYEVCETCDGKGSHVNPSIDAHGISSDEFAEDPDFAESYFRGDYDVPCNECHSRRVVPGVDPDRATKDELKAANDRINDHWSYQAEVEAERRMGAWSFRLTVWNFSSMIGLWGRVAEEATGSHRDLSGPGNGEAANGRQ
jgi:hypothetical protein